jgi:hypothetical protein
MARKTKKPTPITRGLIEKAKELSEVTPALSKKTMAELVDVSLSSLRKIEQTGYSYENYKNYWSDYKQKYDRKRSKKFGAAKINQQVCDAAKLLSEAGMNNPAIAEALKIGSSTVSFIKQADFSYEGYCEIRDRLAAERKAREAKKKTKHTRPEPTALDKTYEFTSTDNVATLAKEFDRAVNLTTVMIEELKKSNQLQAEIKQYLKDMAFHTQQLYTFEHNKNEYRRSRSLFNRK